jgi:hypothetical protein
VGLARPIVFRLVLLKLTVEVAAGVETLLLAQREPEVEALVLYTTQLLPARERRTRAAVVVVLLRMVHRPAVLAAQEW